MSVNKAVQETWWLERASSMVESQIVSRGVRDPDVIRAMKTTPRHLFLPENQRDYAYGDHPLPIGSGQTISQPYVVAIMTEYLELTGKEKVLEIGTGSGYQAAILSQLADSCYTIEVVETLARKSSALLTDLGYTNVVVRWGDGYKGWPEHAPFDRIIVTAAPEVIPEELINQLEPGGRMILPVGSYVQDLVLITKTPGGLREKSIIPVRFVPMIHPTESIPNQSSF